MDTRKNNFAISLKVATGSMDVGQLTRWDLIIPLTEKFQIYDERYSGLLFYEILMVSFSPKEERVSLYIFRTSLTHTCINVTKEKMVSSRLLNISPENLV